MPIHTLYRAALKQGKLNIFTVIIVSLSLTINLLYESLKKSSCNFLFKDDNESLS